MLTWINKGIIFLGTSILRAISAIGNMIVINAIQIFCKIPGGLGIILIIADKVMTGISKAIGIHCDNSAKSLGYKAMNSSTKPKDLNSTQDYIEYIAKKVETDKDNINKLYATESLGITSLGIYLQAKAISEKLRPTTVSAKHSSIPVDASCACSPTQTAVYQSPFEQNISSSELSDIVISLKKQGINNINDLISLL